MSPVSLLLCLLASSFVLPALSKTATFRTEVISSPGNSTRMLKGTLPLPKPPGTVAITRIVMRIVMDSENHESIPPEQIYVHHILVFNMQHQDFMCTKEKALVTGSGGEFSPFILTHPYAYISPGDETWVTRYHLLPQDDQPRNLSIEYEVEYSESPEDFLPVVFVFLDIKNCTGSEFEVPGGGGIFTKTGITQLPRPGILITIVGHMHKGALGMNLTRKGTSICNSVPRYKPNGYLASISGCTLNVSLEAHEPLEISVTYSNSLRLPDAMAIFVGYLHLTGPNTDSNDHGTRRAWFTMFAVGGVGILLGVLLGVSATVLYSKYKEKRRSQVRDSFSRFTGQNDDEVSLNPQDQLL